MKKSIFLRSQILIIFFLIFASVSGYSQGVIITNDPDPPEPTSLLRVHGLGTGEGNVLFTGQWKGAPGPAPVLGPGSRLMWYPDKAAFRAGRVTGTQWNTENIGNYSSATGFNPIASGWYSNAWGSVTTASGAQATAWGFNNIASGTSSTAWGENTTAPSFAETVFGYNNTAYTPASSTEWVATDRLFVIGNGFSGSSDALVLLKNGRLGLGTSEPTQRLEVAGTILAKTSNFAIRGIKTGTGTFPGVWGDTESTSNNATGVRGNVTSTTPGAGSAGVHGRNFGTGSNGIGVKGTHDGGGWGVYGETVSGKGVYGIGSATSGTNYGVYGRSESPDGYNGYFAGVSGSKNYFQQNVGINTTNPTSLLHVLGSVSSTIPLIRAESLSGVFYDGTAVFGKAASFPSSGTGGYFQGGRTGIYAYVVGTGATNMMYGTRSEVSGGNQGGIRYGGYFRVTESLSTNYAVYAVTDNSSLNYAGYFSGNVTVTGILSNPSDISFKQNIRHIENSLSKITQLDGKIYEHRIEDIPSINLAAGTQFGFIAQELELIFPELVIENIHPGTDPYYDTDALHRDPISYKAINYIGLIPILTEAIKEQQKIIEAQNLRIEALENYIRTSE